ncbi:GtrA family protein [Vibrio breoganii]
MLIKYLFVGASSTTLYLILSFTALNYWRFGILSSVTIAFFLSFIYSYTLQNFLVFKASFNLRNFTRYFYVQTSIFIISYFSSTIIFVQQEVIVLFIAASMALVSFFIHKKWTFL